MSVKITQFSLALDIVNVLVERFDYTTSRRMTEESILKYDETFIVDLDRNLNFNFSNLYIIDGPQGVLHINEVLLSLGDVFDLVGWKHEEINLTNLVKRNLQEIEEFSGEERLNPDEMSPSELIEVVALYIIGLKDDIISTGGGRLNLYKFSDTALSIKEWEDKDPLRVYTDEEVELLLSKTVESYVKDMKSYDSCMLV